MRACHSSAETLLRTLAAMALSSGMGCSPVLAKTLAEMMNLRQGMNRRRNALQPGLELQREVAGIVPRLGQVAAMEPQPGLLRGLPHAAQFALPRAGVVGRVAAEAPHLAHAV